LEWRAGWKKKPLSHKDVKMTSVGGSWCKAVLNCQKRGLGNLLTA